MSSVIRFDAAGDSGEVLFLACQLNIKGFEQTGREGDTSEGWSSIHASIESSLLILFGKGGAYTFFVAMPSLVAGVLHN